MSVLRSLLTGVVDYAGLFPPAALDMETAARNYESYRRDGASWMLGRFVVPAARLDELARARSSLVADIGEWRLSALLGSSVDDDFARVRAFNEAHRGHALADTVEGKVATADDVRRIATAARGELEAFAEIPSDDVERMAMLIRSAHREGVHAKLRMGGVTADAFPSAASVVRFLRCCLDAGVAFKATAGLHHPLRAEYRLTYDAGAPVGPMFGYLNVFLAAAFMANGMSDGDAVRLLEERDAAAFDVGAEQLAWNGAMLTAAQAQAARDHVAMSFGSCSFREPVDELQSLALA